MVLLIALIAAVGCGDSDGPVSLSGTVTLDGSPLSNATVQFLAQDSDGRNALGSTDAEGVFHLSTSKPGDGVFPGSYKVIVQPATRPVPGFEASSPMEAMEAASKGQKLNLPAIVLPPRFTDPGQTILVQDVPASEEVVFELTSK